MQYLQIKQIQLALLEIVTLKTTPKIYQNFATNLSNLETTKILPANNPMKY